MYVYIYITPFLVNYKYFMIIIYEPQTMELCHVSIVKILNKWLNPAISLAFLLSGENVS